MKRRTPIHPMRQSARTVLRAEKQRLLRSGGVRGTVVAAGGLGALIGSATLIVLLVVADSASRVLVTTPLEAAAFFTSVVYALGVVFATCRDELGRLLFASSLTPARRRLHLARALATAAVAAFTASGSTGLVGVVACTAVSSAYWTWCVLGVLLAGLGAASLSLLAFGIASLLRSAALSVVAFLSIVILLPLLPGLLGAALPSHLIDLIDGAAVATPGPLLVQAIAVTSIASQGLSDTATGQVGLMLWATGSIGLSAIVFQRRDL